MAGESIRSIATDYHVPQRAVEQAIRLFLCSLRGQRGERVEDRMRETIERQQQAGADA
jgi:hypothetical protein